MRREQPAQPQGKCRTCPLNPLSSLSQDSPLRLQHKHGGGSRLAARGVARQAILVPDLTLLAPHIRTMPTLGFDGSRTGKQTRYLLCPLAIVSTQS